MKKIAFLGANNLLLKYILKVVLSTIISLLLFSFVFSKISYHMDLDLKVNLIFSIIICALCAAITGYTSVLGIKNNGMLLGAVAQLPLLFYSILNVIFNENTAVLFLIKTVIVICTGMLFGHISSRRASKLRLK